MNVVDDGLNRLSLVPLGAGDLIDRAVRFYRRNFWTFVFIASPSIVVGTIISVASMVVARQIFYSGADPARARISCAACERDLPH